MRTNHRRVLWAEELGIDVGNLLLEHPGQWEQLMMKKRLNQRAEDYWRRERQLARVEDYASAPEAEYTPPKRRKRKPKAGKVRRYEFTDKQLEIARRSLNGRDSV
jgi:Zn-finger nucleic acid-binding protein